METIQPFASYNLASSLFIDSYSICKDNTPCSEISKGQHTFLSFEYNIQIKTARQIISEISLIQ